MPALSMTEHGNVSSHVGLEKAALKAGIKPIFGLEAYMHPEDGSDKKFHLTLLAETQVGYQNLNRIVTRSWAENFHRWPTVNGQILADHAEGVICLSGCSDSLLACTLLGGKDIPVEDASFKKAQRVATNFRALFGDRYYLEVQTFPELPRAHKIAQAYARMSEVTGIPLVATADVHTLRPGQAEIRALLHAAGRGTNTIAQQMSSWEYDVPDYTPLSDKKVIRALMGTGLSKKAALAALHHTEDIAARCNVTLPKAARFRYPVEDPEAELWKWLREGWKYRVRQGNSRMTRTDLIADYTAEIELEMRLIVEKDFVSYFLLVADLVQWAKSQGIVVGPGRGSSAASLVCYLTRITEPDPLAFPMTDFSRFVDPTRIDLPDIDIDFEDARRHEVREYAVRRFGGGAYVANVGTFTKYKGKNSLDDVGRVFSIPSIDLAVVKGMIIERSGGDSRADASLLDTFDSFPSAKEILTRHPALKHAIALEGNYKSMSTHSAGLVISDQPIDDITATYTRTVKGREITAVAVNKYDAEYLGLMKIDALGLTTMGLISNMMRDIGMSLEELYQLPLDDPETIAAFTRADVIGIFQFEGRATRLVCREVKPTSVHELIDINALSRPGPLFSGTTTEYIRIKRGQMEQPKIHPIVDRISAPTRGQIIYQEQILHSLAEFGGLPVQRVHEIRRIISQKLGEAQFNTSMSNFVDNAMALHGVDRAVAEKVWERVVTSASYAFVYSHSLSYTIIGYWSMWFKVHHPTVFYRASLSRTKDVGWPALVKDAERHGVHVRGVTLGESGIGWKATEDGGIVAGYEQLPGCGPVMSQNVMRTLRAREEQGRGPFETAEDLLEVVGIGPKTLDKMRPLVNVSDPFGLARLERDMAATRKFIAVTPGLASPTHTSDDLLDIADTSTIFLGKVVERNYQDYVENKRARYGLDLKEILADMKSPHLKTSVVLRCVDDGDEDVYVRVNRFKFPSLKARIDGIRVGHDLILVRGRKNDKVAAFGISVQCDNVIVIDPDD